MMTGIIMAQSDQVKLPELEYGNKTRVRAERRNVQLKYAFIISFDGLKLSKLRTLISLA
jgi:hypothetical protein